MKVVIQLSNMAGELDREEKDFEGEADPDAVDEFASAACERWMLGVGDTIRIFALDEEGAEADPEDDEDEDDDDLEDDDEDDTRDFDPEDDDG